MMEIRLVSILDKLRSMVRDFRIVTVRGNGQANTGFAFSGAQSREFSISVQGELSDDERKAISDLLEQVAEVQESFFSNDIEQAFNKVQGLRCRFQSD